MIKLRKRLELLGLDYKKEIGLLVSELLLALLVAFSGYYIFSNNTILIAGAGSFVSFLILFIFRINKKEEYVSESRMHDFINYFSYFRIYIYNGESVYSSFLKTLDFAGENIKPLIEKLIDDINVDKTIAPYINFAKYFKEKVVEQIMISIYEMVDNGSDTGYINQFSTIFESFKSRNADNDESKRNNKFDTFINSALIGSGVIMVVLVFGIVNLIGEIV